MRKSIVKKIFFSLEPLVRPKSALYALKEVPKRDDGDPRPLYGFLPGRKGGCSLRGERVRTPCLPVGKTRRYLQAVGGTREISSLFLEKSNVPQNLCCTNQLNKYWGTKRLVYDFPGPLAFSTSSVAVCRLSRKELVSHKSI